MKKTSVIIVTYNPQINDFLKNLKEVCRYQAKVVVIDNHSDLEIRESLKKISNERIEYLELPSNKGIGYAQNVGINKEKDSDYYLFLDQDSYLKKDQFEKLLNEFQMIEKSDPHIAALGANTSGSPVDNEKYRNSDKVISSGSIISKKALNYIGLMKEEFFIDFIDYEWCWRAIQKGWHVYQSVDVSISHETTGINSKNGHTVDPVFRLFYIYRNATYIIFHEKIKAKYKINMIIRLGGKLLFQVQLKGSKTRLKECLEELLRVGGKI